MSPGQAGKKKGIRSTAKKIRLADFLFARSLGSPQIQFAGSSPDKSRIGSLLIDLRDVSSVYDEDEYGKLADELSDIIAYWAAKENRVCVIVPHLNQENNNRSGMRLPHLHVIYEKKPREKDALTRFLNSILTK